MNRPVRLWMTALAALVGACLPGYGEDASSSDVTASEHPEAVTIEFRGGSGHNQHCAGTLLSANVVLTAAHCADGSASAVVTAPAKRAHAAVADVYTYSWVAGETSAAKRLMDDVGLLVLRSPIRLPRYPSIQAERCDTCSVVHVGWKASDGSARVATSSTVGVARSIPAEHPMSRFVATKTAVPSGRAFYRAGTKGNVVVGVSAGTGAKSGGSYLSPLHDIVLRRWVGEIVKLGATRLAKTVAKTTSNATAIHLLDEDDGVFLGGSDEGGGDEPVGDFGGEPLGPDVSAPTGPEPVGSGAPVEASPVIAGAADRRDHSDEPATEPSPSTDPGADAIAPVEEIVPAEEPVVGDGRADTSSDESAQPYDQTADGQANGMDPDAVRGAIPGTAPLKQVRGDPPETLTRHATGNSVTVADPTDTAFNDDAEIAKRYAGVANLYNSHGTPGTLLGPVPGEDVQRLMNDDKPLIVASCFSGAPVEGGSTIRRLASSYGDSPEAASRVYGCTGWASGSAANGLDCSGVWVDGNAKAVPAAERERLGLNQMQCTTNQIVERNGQRTPDWRDCVRR